MGDKKSWRRKKLVQICFFASVVLATFLLLAHRTLRKEEILLELLPEWDGSPLYSMVVCTLVKNEAFYLPEWIDFHRGLGVDRFVIYDDRSTDGIVDVLKPYVSKGLVELIPFPPGQDCDYNDVAETRRETLSKMHERCEVCRLGKGRSETHTQANCQLAAFSDCALRYRLRSHWLAFLDVDEFIFPCSRNISSVLEVFWELQYRGVSKVRMECLKFGTADHKQRITAGESLLKSHRKRAPYKHLGEDEEEVRRRVGTCDLYTDPLTETTTPVCETSGGMKHAAVSRYLQPAYTTVHDLTVSQGEFYYSKLRGPKMKITSADICCNHYAYKSEGEMEEKAEKNHNYHIKAQLYKAVPFYNAIKDDEIVNHISTTENEKH